MRALAAMFALAAGACSSAEDAGAPPAAPDEQRALDEARSMIPPSEMPTETAEPAAAESAPR